MMLLREFDSRDAASIALHANDLEVSRYLRDVFPSPYTLADAEWWLSEGRHEANTFNRAIDCDGDCVGSIGVVFQEAEHRFSAEIGYWLGRQHWNKGLGTAAVRQLTERVFANYEIKRIFAPVAAPNKSSMRVLEKSGYECEAILKKNLFLGGTLYDEHIYAIHI